MDERRTPVIITRRKNKKRHPQSGTKSGRSKVWYEVFCPIHGTKNMDNKVVLKVGCPESRKERFYTGCPKCKAINDKKGAVV